MRRLAMTLTLFEMFGIPLQGHDFLKRKKMSERVILTYNYKAF